MRLASVFTDGSHAELSSVVVEPGKDGRVVLLAATPVCAVRVDAEGRADGRVLIPGAIAREVSRRHRDAELLSIRELDEMMLSIRSFSADCTVAISGPRGQVAFEAFPPMTAPDTAETRPTPMSGLLLRTALRALMEAEDLSLLQMPPGLRITANGDRWSATLLVAGMVSKGGQ